MAPSEPLECAIIGSNTPMKLPIIIEKKNVIAATNAITETNHKTHPTH